MYTKQAQEIDAFSFEADKGGSKYTVVSLDTFLLFKWSKVKKKKRYSTFANTCTVLFDVIHLLE